MRGKMVRAGDVEVEANKMPMSLSYNTGMYVDATARGMKRCAGTVAVQSNIEEGRKDAESTGYTLCC